MYESEDSWEDVPQKPLPETSVADSVMAAGESGEETPEALRVPKDEAKSGGNAAKKKKIPRWQWGVLAGLGVVAIGGGAAFALLGLHASGNPPMPQQTAPRGIPDRGTMIHRPTTSSAQEPKGFATLNQFSAPPTTSGIAPLTTQSVLKGRQPSGTAMGTGMTSGMVAPSGSLPSVASAKSSKAAAPSVSASSALSALSSVTSTATSAKPSVAQGLSALQDSPDTSTATMGSDTGIAAQTQSVGQSAPNNPFAQVGSTPASPTPTSDARAVERLKAEISGSQAEIARLKRELQAERSAASVQQPPRVITRTVIRYVHVPVPAVTKPQAQHRSSAPASGSLSGWSVIGGNTNTAMLSGPDGQVLSVRAGDVLPGGSGILVQRVEMGKVMTSDGVIH